MNILEIIGLVVVIIFCVHFLKGFFGAWHKQRRGKNQGSNFIQNNDFTEGDMSAWEEATQPAIVIGWDMGTTEDEAQCVITRREPDGTWSFEVWPVK